MTNNKIQAYAERIERLMNEREVLSADIKDLYEEVKAAQFDPRALRAVIAERRKPTDASLEAVKEAYRAALYAPGATYRSVAEQTGISKSKLQRLVPKNTNGTAEFRAAEIADGSKVVVESNIETLKPRTNEPEINAGLAGEADAPALNLAAEAERLGLTAVVRDLAAKHDEPDLTIPAHLRRTA